MSDTALAADRIRLVAGERGMNEPIKAVLERVYCLLARRYPKSQWTRRRVRSLWEAKAVRVDYREIAEMDAIIAEARKSHAEHKRETARLRAHFLGLAEALSDTDADFHSPDIEGLRGLARGMDRPRIEGERE